jgi:hypothetical protein
MTWATKLLLYRDENMRGNQGANRPRLYQQHRLRDADGPGHLDFFVGASLLSTWLVARAKASILALRKMHFFGNHLIITNSRA